MSTGVWIHDYCGGEVDTSELYWMCTFCKQFVELYACNGNSKHQIVAAERRENE